FPPTAVRLSPDGRYLAVLARLPSERIQPQQMAELWDLSLATPAVVARFPRTREEVGSFDVGNGKLITDIEVSPDSRALIMSHNHEVRIWDLLHSTPGNSPARIIALRGEYVAMKFSADKLAIGSSVGELSIVDLATFETSQPANLTSKDITGDVHNVVFS